MSGSHRTTSLVLISYHFPPFGSPGSHRVAAFARDLPSLGFDVTVVTTDEPRFPRLDPATSAGMPGSLRVVRVGSTATGFHWTAREASRRPGVLLARVVDRFATPDHAVAWSVVAGHAAGRLAAENGASTILTSSPPHSTLIAGRIARALAGPGARWVADLRDPLAAGAGVPFLERCLASADGLVCNTERLEASLRDRWPGARTTTLPNGYDEDAVEQALADPAPRADSTREIVLVHAGALYGGSRDPRALIEAMRRVQAQASVNTAGFRLVLAGADPDRLPPEVREAIDRLPGPARVECPGFLPHGDALRLMASADLLVLFQPRQFPMQVPSKAYEYVALGRPVLALTSDGATADLIRRYDRGHVAAPDDVEAIARVLEAVSDPRNETGRPSTAVLASGLAPGRRTVSEGLARFLDGGHAPDDARCAGGRRSGTRRWPHA